MEKEYLGKFSISQEFTNAFAKLSGDSNPLHVDPVAARRYPFGTTVVHGICSALNALNLLFEALPNHVSLTSIKVQFNKPLRHNDVVEVYRVSTEQTHRIELLSQGKRAQIINLLMSDQTISTSLKNTANSKNNKITLNHYSFSEAASAKGEIKLNWDQDLAHKLFPHAVNNLPPEQIAILLSTTVIVGMKCPGMHSVYGGLNLSFNLTPGSTPSKLDYEVTSSDERFNRLVIGVRNSLCKGEIESFYRAPPVEQPSFNQIKPLISKTQFQHQRALVIGGSRGIGEITAKLLASGGAKTVITYANGEQDAARVVKEITDNGGDCTALHYNVLEPNPEIIHCFKQQPITHIYYLASPTITKGEQPLWDQSLFNKFSSYYLTGLSDVLTPYLENLDLNKLPLTVFIPSTIFLSEPTKGFGEYCAAKAVVEVFAQNMSATYSNWTFFAPRLPRVQTDQTSGIASTDPMETVNIILTELLKLTS